jgi:hypothetical protein
MAAIVAMLGLVGQAEARAPEFGVSATPFPTAPEAQRIARGGVTSVRGVFYWGDVEPSQGALRNWAKLDAVVAAAASSGVRVLPDLFGTPPWLSGEANSPIPPIYTAQGRAGWAAFVTDLARRYGSNGLFWTLHPELPRVPITDWQLWNEVNLRYYWGSRPNARAYANLIRLTRSALKAGDPASRLVLAGLIPFKSVGAGSVPGSRYLQRLFKVKGIRKQFDAVSVHPYGKSPSVVLKFVGQIRKTLNSIGGRKKPLWVTEFGWTTGGEQWSNSPVRATPAQQANWVSKTYKLMRKQRKFLRLRAAFYFSLKDFDVPGPDLWNARMGLFDLNGQPKPAWFSYVARAGGTP